MARNSLVPKSALIRALVEESGISHGQIAVRVGCDRSTISRVVAGQRRIDPLLAQGIAAALGVQTHVIFSRQEVDGVQLNPLPSQRNDAPASGRALC